MNSTDLARNVLGAVTSRPSVAAALRRFTLSGRLKRNVWVHLPPPDGPIEVPVGSESITYNWHQGDPLRRSLYWAGLSGTEAETFPVFRKAIKGARLFIDVGANVGIYSLVACATDPLVEVLAVEAVPRIADMLVEGISANGFEDRIEVLRVAAGASNGTAAFLVPPSNLPTSSRLASAPARGGPVERIEVPVRTIDDMAAGRRVDVVKIDVEGSEADVLVGARNTLGSSHPVVIFELLPENSVDAIEAAFHGLGYRYLALTPGGPQPVSRLTADPERHLRNILAVHSDDRRWADV